MRAANTGSALGPIRVVVALLVCVGQAACGDLIGLGASPVIVDGGKQGPPTLDAGTDGAAGPLCTFDDDAPTSAFDTCTFQ